MRVRFMRSSGQVCPARHEAAGCLARHERPLDWPSPSLRGRDGPSQRDILALIADGRRRVAFSLPRALPLLITAADSLAG